MGGLPLRTPTHRRLGGPLPRQLANAPHGHPPPPWISRRGHAAPAAYAVLVAVSRGYPPVAGRSHTCYSPVRRSPAARVATRPAAPRLACVRPVASVHPEPGSNSPLLFIFVLFFLAVRPRAPNGAADRPRRSAWFPGTDARVWFSVYLVHLSSNRRGLGGGHTPRRARLPAGRLVSVISSVASFQRSYFRPPPLRRRVLQR